MSQTATRKKQCNERLCVDDDTRTVRFPGGATRVYCRTHLPSIANLTGVEVIDDV